MINDLSQKQQIEFLSRKVSVRLDVIYQTLQIIEIMSARNAIKPDELANVGILYNALKDGIRVNKEIFLKEKETPQPTVSQSMAPIEEEESTEGAECDTGDEEGVDEVEVKSD